MIVGLFVSIVAGALTLALLSARWAVGRFDEAAAAPDPVAPLEDVVTMLFYSVQLAPGLTLLPPLAAVLLGEVLRIRSLLYYVAMGGLAAVIVPLASGVTGLEELGLGPSAAANAQGLTVVATAGFAAGFFYWLVAGRFS